MCLNNLLRESTPSADLFRCVISVIAGRAGLSAHHPFAQPYLHTHCIGGTRHNHQTLPALKGLNTVVLIGCTEIILLTLGILAAVMQEKIAKMSEKLSNWET